MSVILKIDDRPFTWAEIDALARGEALVEHTERLSAKVNGEGVRVAALLACAGGGSPLVPGAPPRLSAHGKGITHVVFFDDGDYRACLTLDEVERAAVLAHRRDRAPLPDAMGGPLRLLVPSSANACLSVKRVTRIALLDHAEPDTVPRPTTALRTS